MNTKLKLAQRLAEEMIPDGIGGLSRVHILLARMGAVQMMADSCAGLDQKAWSEAQMEARMRARVDVWVQGVKK